MLADCFAKDDVCRVKGFVVSYQGKLQVNISQIASLPEGEYDLRDFLPSSKYDPNDMIVELDEVIASLPDPEVKALLQSIFKEGGEIRNLYKIAPAAKAMHHPYIGGLIEHVLSMAKVADFVAGHYKISKSILMAGVILHDIGKIYELSYKRGFDYTDEGKLIGHITIGAEIVDKAARELGSFPSEKLMEIKHLVLSHHGIYEYGSPKRPKTVEAIVLAFLDDMDAKVNAVETLIRNDLNEGNWTTYSRMFERFIYKKRPETVAVHEDCDSAPEPAPAESCDSSNNGVGNESGDGKKDGDGDLNLF